MRYKLTSIESFDVFNKQFIETAQRSLAIKLTVLYPSLYVNFAINVPNKFDKFQSSLILKLLYFIPVSSEESG